MCPRPAFPEPARKRDRRRSMRTATPPPEGIRPTTSRPARADSLLIHHLRAHDIDTMAAALQRWDHCWEQLSRGPFVGDIHVLQTQGLQLTKLTVNQVIQARGSQPPSRYAFAPVGPANEAALWRGQRLRTGAV